MCHTQTISSILARYDSIPSMARVRIARPGRKHRIGNAHILAALRHAGMEVIGDALYFVGRDDRGIELEIIAVTDDRNSDDLTVIHAMPTAFRR